MPSWKFRPRVGLRGLLALVAAWGLLLKIGGEVAGYQAEQSGLAGLRRLNNDFLVSGADFFLNVFR